MGGLITDAEADALGVESEDGYGVFVVGGALPMLVTEFDSGCGCAPCVQWGCC